MFCSIFGNSVNEGSMGADFYHSDGMFVKDYIQRLGIRLREPFLATCGMHTLLWRLRVE